MSQVWRPLTAEEVQAKVDEMVRRIVERFQPEKVILFGSRARGDADPDSDVDLLVVMPFDGRRLDRIVEIRLALAHMGIAKDVFLVTPEEFEADKDLVGSLVYPAAHEGRVLHERRP